MDVLYVFSQRPITINKQYDFAVKEEAAAGNYRYDISCFSGRGHEHDGAPLPVLDFIFNAIIERIVYAELCRNIPVQSLRGVVQDGAEASVFAGKLSAYTYVTGTRCVIDNIVKSILQERGVINIDGVINFRLREFSNEISTFFDVLFYEYKVQRQYDEFIALMRDYISKETPVEPVIHIVFNESSFKLYNFSRFNITHKAMKRFKEDGSCTDENTNDFLISSLLLYMPEKIVIHNGYSRQDEGKNDKIIDTVRVIFGERAELCSGCECSFTEKPIFLKQLDID